MNDAIDELEYIELQSLNALKCTTIETITLLQLAVWNGWEESQRLTLITIAGSTEDPVKYMVLIRLID